jgi:hypothetical protein
MDFNPTKGKDFLLFWIVLYHVNYKILMQNIIEQRKGLANCVVLPVMYICDMNSKKESFTNIKSGKVKLVWV